jgi:hypothetical protein
MFTGNDGSIVSGSPLPKFFDIGYRSRLDPVDRSEGQGTPLPELSGPWVCVGLNKLGISWLAFGGVGTVGSLFRFWAEDSGSGELWSQTSGVDPRFEDIEKASRTQDTNGVRGGVGYTLGRSRMQQRAQAPPDPQTRGRSDT